MRNPGDDNLRLTLEHGGRMVLRKRSNLKSEFRLRTSGGPTRTPVLILALFLALPSALVAQKQLGQWSDLNSLKAGQGIDVIELSMKNHGGEFVGITDEVITLREKGSDVSVKRENVARVSTASGARRGEHAVIGLVAGGLIGAGIGAASGSSKTGTFHTRGIGALVGVAIGAPSGAAIGVCIPAHTTIYRAAPR